MLRPSNSIYRGVTPSALENDSIHLFLLLHALMYKKTLLASLSRFTLHLIQFCV